MTAANLDTRIEAVTRAIQRNAVTLGPPLRAEAIDDFEKQHGITLPEDYRRFVVEIGNGCKKGPPHYGLMALGEMPSDHHVPVEEQLAAVGKPFPLEEMWIWENEEELSEEQEELLASVGDGTLVLGTDGCGMYHHLVVTGAERGQIWLVTGEGATPCDPPRDFLSWFEDWLLTETRK